MTLQSSSGRSCIALAGNRRPLAGELLLSPRAKGGMGGGLRPCLWVRRNQIFRSNFLKFNTSIDVFCLNSDLYIQRLDSVRSNLTMASGYQIPLDTALAKMLFRDQSSSSQSRYLGIFSKI